MTDTPTSLQRAQGAMIGLAVGDAIGTTVEFKPRNTFSPMTDMIGGGPFNLEPGQWTDDTSMALCLAESLIERKHFDPLDQMQRYVRWMDDGHMSSNGLCFDIGIATRSALNRFKRMGDPYAGDTSPNNAGNGCLMRLAPVPIRYSHDADAAVQHAENSARTTHQAPECIAATRVLAEFLVRAIKGYSKEQILCEPELTKVLPGKIHAVVIGQSYRKKARNGIRGSGYVVESLEAALWCFDSTDNFKDCVLRAANLGDDADTTAAIAGQLAGAFYGVDGIPAEWVQRIAFSDTIRTMATTLLAQQQLDPVAA